MMKKLFSLLLLVVSMLFMFGCGNALTSAYEKTQELRETATKYEVSKYSQEEFDLAESEFLKAEAWVLEDNKSEKDNAIAAFEVAQSNYTIVIDNGWPLYSEELQAQTSESKAKADEIKANVLGSEYYQAAESAYGTGVTALEKKDYDTALSNLLLAKENYTAAYDNVYDKYQQSSDALESVKAKIEEIQKMEEEIANLSK